MTCFYIIFSQHFLIFHNVDSVCKGGPESYSNEQCLI